MEVNRWWSKVMDSFHSFFSSFLISLFCLRTKKWNICEVETGCHLNQKWFRRHHHRQFYLESQLKQISWKGFLSCSSLLSPTSQLSFKEKSSLSLSTRRETTWNKSPSLMCDTKRDSMCFKRLQWEHHQHTLGSTKSEERSDQEGWAMDGKKKDLKREREREDL